MPRFHRYCMCADRYTGIDFSPDRPPSSIQLFKLLANPAFRKGLQKLRDDLANAGVNVNPEVRALRLHRVSHPTPWTSERNGDVECIQRPRYQVEMKYNTIVACKSNSRQNSP
jgi:hypothetical protein